MVRLYEICSKDFVLIRADQTVKLAKEAVKNLTPGSIIVRRWYQGEAYYYLCTFDEFLKQVNDFADDLTLESPELISRLDEFSTPSLDIYQDAKRSPLRCVVIDKDRVVGFIDGLNALINPVSIDPRLHRHRPQTRGTIIPTSIEPVSRSVRADNEPVSRSVMADFPEKVKLGEISSLLVRLTSQPVQNNILPIYVPLGTEISIVIDSLQGFSLESSEEGSLRVTSEEETLPIQFKLRATEIGPGRIRVLAFNSGQPLGSITLAPIIVSEDQITSEQRYTGAQPIAPLPIAQPDLTLLILEDKSQGSLVINYYLTASNPDFDLYFTHFDPIELTMEPLQYFQEFFKDIEGMNLDGFENQIIAAEKLARRGAGLFKDLIPEDLRVKLWDLQDHISTVQVLSDEPWIPWELLKLQGKQGNRVVEGRFFSEAFEMTRWLPGIGRRPNLSLKNIALVVPSDSGLPNAQDECNYLLSIAGDQRKVSRVPATYLEIKDALSKGVYDGWHFTGHGSFEAIDPNSSEIRLEKGQILSPIEISGEVSNCGLARPLVFLNACQTGREAFSLTGIGGWAESFIEAGAAVFIGSLWSVGDEAAYKFAKAFYGNLLSGMSIGSAVKKARDSIKPNSTNNPINDPTTWLAYTVFADPFATVQRK